MWDDIGKPIVCLMAGIFLLMWVITFSIYKYTVEVAEANIVKLYVNNELVFTGKKAFVDITSGGMTTTATVYKKLFPFSITDKIYSDSNIKLTN